ncbi:putative RuvC-like Holliday junction resolvase [Golden Marseillevirus]|uniref:putative RuvC-like Holliday junction resolvase n=1 Tax=Golden Marseillevirus TaxID=1720526 RepID=UPI000877AF34|nr:putative RuvC-like Holliday junction resolvase [Golden Marseillevirus]ALX27511.1 putative RuvC-like Holliday junction resolvase [Golden Marseillevirus]
MSLSRTLKTFETFEEIAKGREYVSVASFDVGWKAFAWSVERWSVEDLKAHRKKFLSTKYKKDRQKGTSMYQQVLDDVIASGKYVDMDVFDISSGEKKLDVETRINLFFLLQQNKHLWDDVSIVSIEQQFCTSFGKSAGKKDGTNMDAIKLAECLMSWMLINYGDTKVVVFVPTNTKTNILGAPKMPKKLDRKKWIRDKAITWAQEKGEKERL